MYLNFIKNLLAYSISYLKNVLAINLSIAESPKNLFINLHNLQSIFIEYCFLGFFLEIILDTTLATFSGDGELRINLVELFLKNSNSFL